MLVRTLRTISKNVLPSRKHYKHMGPHILLYHGVVEQKFDSRLERNFHLMSAFTAHVNYLRTLRVLSLAELGEVLNDPTSWDEPSVAITFDDGYANNLLACEILSRAGLPAAIFVSTNAVGRDRLIWTVELSLLLLHGQSRRIELFERTWHLTNRSDRESAFQQVRAALKAMPAALKSEHLEQIRQQFPSGETQRLLAAFPSLQMLSWGELSGLSNSKVEIGSHGVNHEIHHPNQPIAVRHAELSRSKAEIESKLGKPCNAFAYPNGDFTPVSSDELRNAGYKLAFTTQESEVEFGIDPYTLPRITPVGRLAF